MSYKIPNSLIAIGITNEADLKKFFKLWSKAAEKLIKQYIKEHSIVWYNKAWKEKSKDIPFFIRSRGPKSGSTTGDLWFASNPINKAFDKSTPNIKDKQIKFPKHTKVKSYQLKGKWITPKKYKPDITGLDLKDIDGHISATSRIFASKTSHNKTHKYSKPKIWVQNTSTNEVYPLNIREQLADKIYKDPETYNLIKEAFDQTVKEFNS